MLSANNASQGKHGQGDESNRLSHDAVKLLKSQDAGYLRTVAGRGRRELERLEQVVGLESAICEKKKAGKKVVFVDGVDVGRRGKKRKSGEMDDQLDMVPTMNGSEGNETVTVEDSVENGEVFAKPATPAQPKSKKTLQAEQQALADLRAARKRRKRLGELRAAKLEALKKRQKEIMAAADKLELQRAKMSRTVGGVNRDGVKWKVRERKK